MLAGVYIGKSMGKGNRMNLHAHASSSCGLKKIAARFFGLFKFR